MGMWRPHNLYYRKAMDDASTWKDELPEAGKCTRLVVECRQPTTGGQHHIGLGALVNDSRIADRITKLEVVIAGNRPIKSLTGLQAQILDFYRNKRTPPDTIRDPSLGPQTSYFVFDFGREFGDKEYYMDWAKHKVNELRVTNDVDGTIFDALTVSVDEYIWEGEDLPESKGIFNDRELKSYTTVQNGEEPTEIPSEDPIRSLALQVIPANTSAQPYHWNDAADDCVEVADLSILETRLKILDNYYLRELAHRNAERYGFPRTGGKYCTQTVPEAVMSGIGIRLGTNVSFADIACTGLITNFMGVYTYTDNPLNVSCQSATNAYYDWSAWGESYQDSFMLFDSMDDIIEGLITKDSAPVRLKLKTKDAATAASATAKILLSTLQEL